MLSTLSIVVAGLAAVAPSIANSNLPSKAEVLQNAAEMKNGLLLATDRYIALPHDEDFIFDFFNPPSSDGITVGSAGHTVNSSPKNFPALIGTGVSMTLGFLGPCGLNTPHTHPRATEINIAINGTLKTGLMHENGARLVSHQIEAGQMTVFPIGAIHFEQNLGCEPAFFVAAFNHEDPGVSQIASRFFSLPADVVGTSLGGLGVEEVVEMAHLIPDNVALGTDECLKRCGLTRPPKPEKQIQLPAPAPVIQLNGLGPGQPSNALELPVAVPTLGSVPPSGNNFMAGSGGSYGSSSGSSKAAVNEANPESNNKLSAANGSGSGDGSEDNWIKPFVIALGVINLVFILTATAVAVGFFMKRGRRIRSKSGPSYGQPSDQKEALFIAPPFDSPKKDTYSSP